MKRPRIFGQRSKAERMESRRRFDVQRAQRLPWRSWYGLKVWQDIRELQLAEESLCRRCLADDGIAETATVVNHIGGHGGDWDRFISGPFESLCKPHHDRDAQREERQAQASAIGRGWVNR